MGKIESQVVVKVGGDASGFKATAGQVSKTVNTLSEQFSKFAFSGIGFAAIGNTMKDIVEYARNMKGELNENERAAKSFATSLDGLYDSFMRGGVNVLGWINKTAAAGTEGMMRQLNAVGLVTDQQIKNLEISEMAEANAEKFAQWKEKEGKEQQRLNEEIAAAEARVAEARRGALDTAAQQAIIMGQVRDLEEQVAKAGEFTLAGKKLKVELIEKEAELVKVTAKLEEEGAKAAEKNAADKKKSDEEKIKAAQEYAKAIALSAEEEIELGRLTLKQLENVDLMTRAEKDQLEILRLKKEQKANMVQVEALLKNGVENLSKEELKQLDTLAKANGVLEKRISSLQPALVAGAQAEVAAAQRLYSITQAIADEEARRLESIEKSRRIKAATIGGAAGELSNYELRAQIKSIASELKIAQAANPGGSITGNLTGAEYVLYSNMKALEGELKKREQKASSEESSKLYDAIIESGGTVADAMQAANFPEFYEWQKRMSEMSTSMMDRYSLQGQKQAEQLAKDGATQNALLGQMNENLRVIRTQLGNGGLDEARKY